MLVGEINIGIRDSYTSKCFWNCPWMTIGRIMQINKEHMKNYKKTTHILVFQNSHNNNYNNIFLPKLNKKTNTHLGGEKEVKKRRP
jgi:hypothetical protein